MEKVLEFSSSLYKDRMVLTITTDSHKYQATITHGDIRPYERQLSITLSDIEEYLNKLSLQEINQCFDFLPHNILSIAIGSLGNSGMKLPLKCHLTPLNSQQRSGYSTWQQEQRMLKLQSQNFDLKMKVEMLSSKVEEQEERIREINDWVKTEMLRLREQLQGRIDSHSLELQMKSKISWQGRRSGSD